MAFRAHVESALGAALPAASDAAWHAVAEASAVAVFARSRSTETVVIEIDGVGRVVRKSWTWPRGRDRLKGALRTTWAARSPARREFDALARLVALPGGSFAPPPLAWFDHREGGVLRACMLLVTEIRGASDLARRLAATHPGAARTRMLTRFAERLRAMHDAGLVDFEMHPRNVIVVPETDDVLKVDCAKQRVRRGPASAGDRARDLAALDVGFVRLVATQERAEFFRVYGADALLMTLVERERTRIDARESKRLPTVN